MRYKATYFVVPFLAIHLISFDLIKRVCIRSYIDVQSFRLYIYFSLLSLELTLNYGVGIPGKLPRYIYSDEFQEILIEFSRLLDQGKIAKHTKRINVKVCTF